MITINSDMFLKNIFEILTKMSWVFFMMCFFLLLATFLSKKVHKNCPRSPIVMGCITCVIMSFICRWVISII